MYNQISQHNDGSIPKINVLIITSTETNGVETAFKYKDKNGEFKYKGFLYEAFLKIKKKLKNKYEFNVKFTDASEQNYDNFVRETAAGKYDIVVGGFFLNEYREKLINFSYPFFFNAYSIVQYKKLGDFEILLKLILALARPIFLLIGLGLIFGIILHFIEPKRGKILDTVKLNMIKGKRRTILTSIASFFGEMGFLTENTNLSIISVITVIIIMIVAFTIILIVQAKLTTLSLSLEEKENINLSNLNKFNFIGFEGNSETQKLDKLGANVKYLKNMSLKEGIDYYIKNKNKYSGGLITSHTNGYSFVKNNSNLKIKYEGLGIEPCSWILNKNQIKLLEDINQQIIKLIDNGEMKKICTKYIKFKNACIG